MEKEIYESPVMEEIELEESFSFGMCLPSCGVPFGHGHRHRP